MIYTRVLALLLFRSASLLVLLLGALTLTSREVARPLHRMANLYYRTGTVLEYFLRARLPGLSEAQ